MKNKWILLTVTTLLFTSTFIPDVFAQNVSSQQNKLNQLNKQINTVKNKLLENNKKEKNLSTQIKTINEEIEQAEADINDLNLQIDEKEQQIKNIKQELEKRQEKIREKNDTLGARLNVMYRNGNISYLQVLLKSESFVDMMSRLDMIKRIVESDMGLLRFMKSEKDKLDNDKKLIENQQSSMIALANSAKVKQQQLVVSRGKIDRLKKDILADNKKLEQQEDELNRYAADISSEIRALQTNEVYKGGKLAWPAPGYSKITSLFGYRIHPILKTKKLHTGMDVAVPTGGNIVAAESGTVIFSGWKGSYGNTVMVDHGSGLVTLYPHNSKLVVKTGDKVKRQQVVAKAGSTGMSTGPHLHFEVRKNGQYVDPKPWLGI